MSPPNKYFPSEDLSKCLARVARANPEEINHYGWSTDLTNTIIPVERVVAKHMYNTFGITIPEQEICLANGATEGLYFVLSTIAGYGDAILLESPGFLGAYHALQRLYLEPIEIETKPPHGLNIDHLEEVLRAGTNPKPKGIIVTPNFQNPTGSLMPIENRERLLHLCRKYDVIVIEDDVFGALRYGKRLPTLKELAPDDVIYVNSYSKVMAPGYRVGWIVGGKYSRSIKIVQGLESFVMTTASHLALAQYMQSGKYKPYVQNLRQIYEENSHLMTSALKKSFPAGTKVYKPEGGQYIWVEMPANISADHLYSEARKHGDRKSVVEGKSV
jgi:DNA-binding transcriptional MocR family regulator